MRDGDLENKWMVDITKESSYVQYRQNRQWTSKYLRIKNFTLFFNASAETSSYVKNMAFEQVVALPILIRHALTDPMKNLRHLL